MPTIKKVIGKSKSTVARSDQLVKKDIEHWLSVLKCTTTIAGELRIHRRLDDLQTELNGTSVDKQALLF